MIVPSKIRELRQQRSVEDFNATRVWFERNKDVPVIKFVNDAITKGLGNCTITLEDVDTLMADYDDAIWFRKHPDKNAYIVDWTLIELHLRGLGYELDHSCSNNYYNERLFITLGN